MTYEDWIEQVKKVILQYEEGAILAGEAFNAILHRSTAVEQYDFCPICGAKVSECQCPEKV